MPKKEFHGRDKSYGHDNRIQYHIEAFDLY